MQLFVLFDANCGLCWKMRNWLASQATFVPLHFLAAGSEGAKAAFPGLRPESTLGVLHVVSDRGRVWKGPNAWVMCLWATRRWRALSLTLSSPTWNRLIGSFVTSFSSNRHFLTSVLGMEAPAESPAPSTVKEARELSRLEP